MDLEIHEWSIKDWITCYTDGSYLSKGDFAGSACFFAQDSPLNTEQYLPRRYGHPCALNAEIYAIILALAAALCRKILKIEVRSDCQNAIDLLNNIDYRLNFAQNKALLAFQISKYNIPKESTSGLLSLCQKFWFLIQYIDVRFHHIYGHSISPYDIPYLTLENTVKKNNKKRTRIAISQEDYVGNDRVDKMAQRAANFSRYTIKIKEMDQRNPLLEVEKKLATQEMSLSYVWDSWSAQKYGKSKLSGEEYRLIYKFWTQLLKLEQMLESQAKDANKDGNSSKFENRVVRSQDLKGEFVEQFSHAEFAQLWNFPICREKLLYYSNPLKPLFIHLDNEIIIR